MLFGLLSLTFGLVVLSAALSAAWPWRWPRVVEPVLAIPSMLSWLALPQLVVLEVLLGVGSAVLADEGVWLAAAVTHGLALLALAALAWRGSRARPLLDGERVEDPALALGGRASGAEPGLLSHWWANLLWRADAADQVAWVRGVVYREVEGRRLRLDVVRPRERSGPLPVVVFLHGGAWVMGTRAQSWLYANGLAAAGFVVVLPSYRLAPRYPLPAALIDAKAAVAWVRDHADQIGARPDCVFAMGASAGGHLASMLALSAGDASLQPGFEDADTSVRGVVSLYGVADLEGPVSDARHPLVGPFLERVVLRAPYTSEPERFRSLSPLRRACADAPPMLLVHGEADGLVPRDESRRLVEALRDCGARRVHLLTLPGVPHAFSVFPSPASWRALQAVRAFLESLA